MGLGRRDYENVRVVRLGLDGTVFIASEHHGRHVASGGNPQGASFSGRSGFDPRRRAQDPMALVRADTA